MKAILETEQTRMVEVAEKSIGSISTILTASMWVLGILTLAFAVLGFLGWRSVHSASIKKAEKVAKARMKAYMDSEEFKTLITSKVDELWSENWQNRVVSPTLDIHDKDNQGASPFPTATTKGDAT
ncbi:hypothetical protein R5W60_04650 [Brucella pseudintermedia]|uniref:hypothetical protein n=1 Tax=Brucella pseudintermedia TaxID=370111 RepID=UPI00366EF4CF|nr:hypothetical protein R5W60_04650 [Brucella pseudintermedia]